MLQWAEQYGGVYKMEIIGNKYVVVTDPALIPEVVGRGSAGLPKSRGYAMWDAAISPHKGIQGLFTVMDNNATWRAVRRAYGPAMGPGTMGVHYPIVVSCCERLAQRLVSEGDCGATSLELNSRLKLLTLDMLGLSAFGIDFGLVASPGMPRMAHDIEAAMHECGERGRGAGRRLAPWLFRQDIEEGQAAMDSFHATCEDIWRTIQARGPPADDDVTFGAQLLRFAQPGRGGSLSEQQILAEIATVVVAGFETTANALTWMIFALHRHPQQAAQLRQELRDAGFAPEGADGAALHAAFSRPGALDELNALPYLDAYIRECLRRYTITPNGALKQAELPSSSSSSSGGSRAGAAPPQPTQAQVQGVTIGGYEVDAGTCVWVPFWSVHLNKDHWDEPWEFRPERWVGQDPRSAGAVSVSRCPVKAASALLQSFAGNGHGSSSLPASSGSALQEELSSARQPASAQAASAVALLERAPKAPSAPGSESDSSGSSTSSSAPSSQRAIRFLPFSDGSRNCVGQHLAMLQLKATVAYLASRFDFVLDEQRMGGDEGAMGAMRVNLTLEVEGGMWLRAVPRA